MFFSKTNSLASFQPFSFVDNILHYRHPMAPRIKLHSIFCKQNSHLQSSDSLSLSALQKFLWLAWNFLIVLYNPLLDFANLYFNLPPFPCLLDSSDPLPCVCFFFLQVLDLQFQYCPGIPHSGPDNAYRQEFWPM